MGRAFEYRKAAKMKRWGNMSRIFPKLAKAVQIAAKEGGGDPDMNAALRVDSASPRISAPFARVVPPIPFALDRQLEAAIAVQS